MTVLGLDLHSLENVIPKLFIRILPVNFFWLLWPHLPSVKSFVAFCLMMQRCNRHLHPLNSTNSPGIRLAPILLTPHMLQKGPLTTVVEHLVKTFGTISLRFHHCQHASLALWQKGRLNCWREFDKLLHTEMCKNT